MISEKTLKEFILLYREEFGEEVDEATATELGINLLVFFKNTYRPIKKSWLDEYEQLQKETGLL